MHTTFQIYIPPIFYLNFLIPLQTQTQNRGNMGLNKQGLFSFTPILILKHSFHTLSLTLLSLLLPLSFLLLSKLTSSPSISLPPSTPCILHLLVSFLSISSLLYLLTGALLKPSIPISWALLVTFQVCVSLGIESTISSVRIVLNTPETSYVVWVERAIFSIGLYETMLYWMRVFVKHVVDDTVYGYEVEEKRLNRVAIGAAFGGLCIWILKGEVEPLVFVGGMGGREVNNEGWNGFVVWVVSYTTLVIGMVKVVEMIFWVGSWLFYCCWRRRGEAEDDGVVAYGTNVDQV